MEELKNRVEAALEKVRPYLVADGGNIELVDVTEDYTAQVRLTGACSGCPFSVQTLKAGVEVAVMKEVPEVKAVVEVS